MTPADLAALIRYEMRASHDTRVVAHVTALMVAPPRPLVLAWPYGEVGVVFDGFLVLDHSRSGTGIAYCLHGFGPAAPWGLIFTNRESPPSTGTSDGWYPRFLDAYFESKAPADLDIWRVRERNPGQARPGFPASSRGMRRGSGCWHCGKPHRIVSMTASMR